VLLRAHHGFVDLDAPLLGFRLAPEFLQRWQPSPPRSSGVRHNVSTAMLTSSSLWTPLSGPHQQRCLFSLKHLQRRYISYHRLISVKCYGYGYQEVFQSMTSQCLVVTAVDIGPWTSPLQNRNILLSATSKLYLSLGRYLGHLFYCYTAMVHQAIVYLEVFLYLCQLLIQ
jgi:hypothetical protein